MVAILGDAAILEHNDAVGHAHGGKAMRNEQGHLAHGKFCEALKYFVFAASVQRCGMDASLLKYLAAGQ